MTLQTPTRLSWTPISVYVATCLIIGQVKADTSTPSSTPRNLQATGQNSPIPDSLSLDEAVRVGVARNPQTTISAATIGGALANYKSLAAIPPITLGITRAQGTSTAPTLTGANQDTIFDLGEVVDTSGQRRFQAAGAKAQLGSTRFQATETKLTLEQEIRDAYWSLAAARSQEQYALESLQEAQRVNQLIKTQHEAGASPQVDVIRSSIDVANALQAYITAQGAERTALSALNVLLVRPPFAPIKLSDDIATGVNTSQSAAALPELPVLTKSAMDSRAVIKSAVEQVRVAEYAVKQARAARLPDLSVDYQRSAQASSDTLLLGVQFPLVDFGSVRYSIKSAQEAVKQAVAQKEQAEQQVSQQIAQAYQDAVLAQSQLTSYLADILNPSVALRDMAQLGYKQGATGILPVIDAESTLRNARTGYINALLAVRKAQDELMAALGGPIPH